ncbi:ABC transporter permease [Paenibacillus piri]|uniref:ABC transporter permease n=1 Tax=Paenibacillus piri TaxID=2547395 RepID=A0A4R5KMS4_9BACL|nr:ABC transporter permease [Paenibacillus piri]TDF95927.1 ABC transporter permease [Paenibacillus piri]
MEIGVVRPHEKKDRRIKHRWSNLALLSPVLLVYGCIFILPFLLLVNNSFHVNEKEKMMWERSYTLDNYGRFFTDSYFLKVILQTFGIGMLVVAVTLLLGYFIAYHIYKAKSFLKTTMITLLLTPSFTGALIQSLGMYLFFARYGPVNVVLVKLGILSAPYNFLGTYPAVIIALVHSFIPFMVLPIVNSLRSIPLNVLDAARSLGGSPATTFLRVVLPLTRGGMLAGSALVFGATVGSFATPAIVGQGKIRLIGQVIYQQAIEVFDWPFAAVISIFLLAILGIVTFALIRPLKTSGGKPS